MKNVIILLIILLFSLNVFGSYPTAEGLFRNGNNKEVSGAYVVLKFQVEESEEKFFLSQNLDELETIKSKKELPGMAVELSQEVPAKLLTKYLKWIFSLKNENQVDLLQIMYSDSRMRIKDIEDVRFIRDYNKKIENEENIDRAIFYSLISTLVLNDSVGLIAFLKRRGVKFPSNQLMMNRDKIVLLEKYRKYLQTKKDDENINQTILESPFESEDPEIKKNITELLNSKMYKKSKSVTLSRVDGDFFWQVEMLMFKALFSNNKRELYKIEFHSEASNIKTMVGNYLLFDGVHYLPKKILFDSSNGQNYKIRMLELKHYQNPKSIKIKELEDKYKKVLGLKPKASATDLKQVDYNTLFFIR